MKWRRDEEFLQAPHSKKESNVFAKRGDENSDQLKGHQLVALALDGINDPQNVGMLCQTAVYFGIRNLILSSNHSALITPHVVSASCGAVEFVRVIRPKSRTLKEGLELLRRKGYNIVVTTVDPMVEEEAIRNDSPENKDHDHPTSGARTKPSSDVVDLSVPTVLVLGSEYSGVSLEVASVATHTAHVRFGPSAQATQKLWAAFPGQEFRSCRSLSGLVEEMDDDERGLAFLNSLNVNSAACALISLMTSSLKLREGSFHLKPRWFETASSNDYLTKQRNPSGPLAETTLPSSVNINPVTQPV